MLGIYTIPPGFLVNLQGRKVGSVGATIKARVGQSMVKHFFSSRGSQNRFAGSRPWGRLL